MLLQMIATKILLKQQWIKFSFCWKIVVQNLKIFLSHLLICANLRLGYLNDMYAFKSYRIVRSTDLHLKCALGKMINTINLSFTIL